MITQANWSTVSLRLLSKYTFAYSANDEATCPITTYHFSYSDATPTITPSQYGVIDSTSVSQTDVPDPPNSAAKLITISYDTKVEAMTSSTTSTAHMISPITDTQNYELMLGECSWILNHKSTVGFATNISIISEMNTAISMPVPTYLLEMTNQPAGYYCSGTFNDLTVTTTPPVLFTHIQNVDFSD